MSLFFLYSDLTSRYSAIFLSCLSQLSVKLPNVSFVFSRSASSPVIFFFELLMSEPAAQISFNSSNLFLSFSRDVSYDSLSDFFFSISTVILVNFFSSSASDFFKSFKSPNDLISASALAFIFKYFSFNSLYIFSFSASSFLALSALLTVELSLHICSYCLTFPYIFHQLQKMIYVQTVFYMHFQSVQLRFS